MSRLKKRLLLVGALLAVGGAAVGIAYAMIPSGGVINGCYQKSNGSLRVIGTNPPLGAALAPTPSGAQRDQVGPTGATGQQVRRGNGANRSDRRYRGDWGDGPDRRDRTDGSDRGDGRHRRVGCDRAEGRHGCDRADGCRPAQPGLPERTPSIRHKSSRNPSDVPPHVVSPAVHQDAICPAGMMAVSGGYFIANLDPNAPPGALISWRPSQDRWQVFFYNPSTTVTVSAQTIAYCAPTS